MRIFGKKRITEEPELLLVPMQESGRYDVSAVLAKALLLFLLVYGALGGFLSAFEIEYNQGLCMLMLFALALLLSAVYETGKKWLTNMVSLLLFAVYLYIAVANYWVINSGYYAVLNRFYELARQYLDVDEGTEYTLMIDDPYLTISVFALFLGMVGVILLNIMMQNKCSLIRVVLITLSAYVFPFYLECSPKLIYIVFLLTGYLAVAVIQCGNVREKITRQIRYVLPLAAVLAVLLTRAAAFLLPGAEYDRMIAKNARKEATEEFASRFAQFGMMAFFPQRVNGAGISGGMLSRGPAVMPEYETDLIVRYTPYSFQPVYLKAFTGKDYLGTRWTEAGESGDENALMEGSVEARKKAYEREGDSETQGRGVMEIEYAGASREYEYRPYYTEKAAAGKTGDVSSYTYYPYYSAIMDHPETFVTDRWDEDYLTVPLSCRAAVQEVCEKAGFWGNEGAVADQIVAFFNDNYSYTLRPGYYMGNSDYISHFLLESRKGYCAHFASAATMLFRQMGIPARYVEGYAFSYLNVVEDGLLVEGEEYGDYFDGYSALGETALVEIEIPDAYAHAWVEIYVDGRGWVVVDPTPAQTEQEEATSFWEAFMNAGSGGSDLEMDEDHLGGYLESALGGIGYLLFGAAVLAAAGLGVAVSVRVYREKKLPGRERVRLEYGRICSWLGRRHEDYRRLRTLGEQLDWMRRYGRAEISGELETALYQVFFAQDLSCDCEQIYLRIRKLARFIKTRNIHATQAAEGGGTGGRE